MASPAAQGESGHDLCLACGICCKGSFFETVRIDDMQKLLRHRPAGIEFETVEDVKTGKQYFKLPCPAHRGGRCTIYEDRPLACKKFKCILLEAHTRNEIGFDDAIGIVNNAKDREATILRRIAELDLPLKGSDVIFDLLYQAYAYWQKLEPGELKEKCGDLVLQIASLRFFIGANFMKLEKPD